jgi:transposase
VDWGHLGSLSEDGRKRQLWDFTMTLGYNRRMYAAAATDQKLGTLLRMHEAAFYEWGVVPEEILYDRMKTVWTGNLRIVGSANANSLDLPHWRKGLCLIVQTRESVLLPLVE